MSPVKGLESMSCETPGCIVNLFLKFTNVKMEGQINNLIEIELKNNCVFMYQRKYSITTIRSQLHLKKKKVYNLSSHLVNVIKNFFSILFKESKSYLPNFFHSPLVSKTGRPNL